MRRYYRQPYQPPTSVRRRGSKKTAAEPLVQPEWDGTIHDLTKMRASPDELLRRKLSRMSHNHMSLALRQGPAAAAAAGSSRERYSGSRAHGDDADDCHDSELDSEEDEEDEDELPGSQQQPPRWHQQQQYGGTRGAGAAAAAAAGYACSEGGSDSLSGDVDADDLCRWDSPLQQQRRHVLRDAATQQLQDKQGGGGARDARWWDQHLPRHAAQQEEQAAWQQQQQLGGPQVVQVLLDKIEALDAQLQRQQQQQAAGQPPQPSTRELQLQQQLRETQQQLSDAQLQLQRLQDEHREFVGHASRLLTLLQAQMQRLLPQQPPVPQQQLAPLEELQQILAQQLAAADAAKARPQQQQHSSPARSPGTTHGQLPAQQPPSVGSSLRQRLSAAAVVSAAPGSPPKWPAGGSSRIAIADTLELPAFAGLKQQQAAAAATSTSGVGQLQSSGLQAPAAAAAGGEDSESDAAASIRGLQNSLQQLQFTMQGERRNSAAGGGAANAGGLAPPGGAPLPIRAGPAAIPSVIFWQSSEASSPRPQQLDMSSWGAASSMPHLHLSSAAGVQAVRQQQQHGVLAEHAAGPAAALAGSLLSSSRGDGVLPGLPDVDRGVSEELSRSAVGRFYSAAGASLPPAADEAAAARRAVQPEELRGNVSLRDHLASIDPAW